MTSEQLKTEAWGIEKGLRELHKRAKDLIGTATLQKLLLDYQLSGMSDDLVKVRQLADALHVLGHGGWPDDVIRQESRDRSCQRYPECWEKANK